MAATLATGVVCSLLPVLGATSLLNLGVGLACRMNQPVLQALNQILGPVQIAMIFVYVRLGEGLWGAIPQSLSPSAIILAFSELSTRDFLAQFGWTGIHALTAWILTAPVLFLIVFLPLQPVFRRMPAMRRTAEART